MWKNLLRDFVFSIILTLGLMLRLVYTPYTAGSDIAQFASFSDTFLRHGFNFYEFADGRYYVEEGWPYNWPYVYGPQLILLLAPLRAFFNQHVTAYWSNGNYYVYAPVEWVVACKALFISFDVVAGVLIYIILSRSGGDWLGILGLALYYLNPAVIYNSSIYGMFDQIPLAVLLASIYLIKSGRSLLGVSLAGFAASFKPNIAPASIGVLASSMFEEKGLKRRLLKLALFLTGLLSPFIPFEASYPGTISRLINILLSMAPGYTYPVVYSFNGFSSLATYMHEHSGGDYQWAISYWWVSLIVLVAVVSAGVVVFRKRDGVVLSFLLYLAFTASYWRVNYQYLTPAVGLASLQLAGGRRRLPVILVFSAYVALWFFLFPVSWWAHVHIETPNQGLWRIMDMFSLMVFDEGVYVLYSLVLTMLSVIVLLVIALS